MLWRWIFSPDFGLLNLFLSYFNIEGPNWLGNRTWVLPSFVIMSLWGVGGGMVIYLAGLQGIPTDLYEAVRDRWCYGLPPDLAHHPSHAEPGHLLPAHHGCHFLDADFHPGLHHD